MIGHMRHMGKSGRTAIGASLAALALLVLTGATLNETVGLWFLAACALAYVACVAEVVIRRRHKTLLASGAGSILFIAFGIAFLRQWGLAFNPDPEALSTRVDAEHPDLYFYLSAAAGAATLLLWLAGTVLPGRGPARRSGYPSRRPAPRRPAARPSAPRTSAPRTAVSGTARPRASTPRPSAPRTAAPRSAGSQSAAPRTSAPRSAAPRASTPRPSAPRSSAARTPPPAAKRPSSSAKPAAKVPPKPAPKPSTRR